MASIAVMVDFWQGSDSTRIEIIANGSDTIRTVVQRLLEEHFPACQASDPSQFEVLHEGSIVDFATTLDALLRDTETSTLSLEIRPTLHIEGPQEDFDSIDGDVVLMGSDAEEEDRRSYVPLDDADCEDDEMPDDEDSGFLACTDDALSDDVFSYEDDEMSSWDAAEVTRSVNRRATVRYFERMNPLRAYPLLVALTKDDVEGIDSSGVRQESTRQNRIRLKRSLTVEPILPGCMCYPSKRTVQINHGNDEVSCRFFVVPMIEGTIEGAQIIIRQGKRTLSEMALRTTVVPKTWTVISAVLTIVVPFVVALLRYFRVNIGTNVEDSADLYVAVASTIVGHTPPTALGMAFLVLTVVLFWRSRPLENDVFWSVKTKTPDARFAEIRELSRHDSGAAARQLTEFLNGNPQHREGQLFYANWHFELRSFELALDGFERAMSLGELTSGDFLRASLSASRLGNFQRALEIIQKAEKELLRDEFTPVLFFNAGCYACRMSMHEDAIEYLRRAIDGGFRDRKNYESDPDLKPLQEDPDFLQLINAI